MKESQAWLEQIESDFTTLEILAGAGDADLRFQIIAKCQQVVEKSLNAIDALLREKGLIAGTIRARTIPIA